MALILDLYGSFVGSLVKMGDFGEKRILRFEPLFQNRLHGRGY